MGREARVLTIAEMVAVIALGQYILDLRAWPQRWIMPMEEPNVFSR